MISYIKYLPPSHLLLSALTLRLLHPKHILVSLLLETWYYIPIYHQIIFTSIIFLVTNTHEHFASGREDNIHNKMANMMMTNHYTSQPSVPYGYGQPQGPPSPPMDDTSKCSLPSISNLLGLADGGSPTSEQFPGSQQGKGPRRQSSPSSY